MAKYDFSEDDGFDQVLAAINTVEVGARLGPYRLTRRLGSGAMGEVFAGEHEADGTKVAIKYVGRSQSTDLHRFKREFRAFADLRHPNLVHLDELVVLPDQHAFYTMELIEGKVFHKYVRGGTRDERLPNVVRARRALRQLLAGLCHIHAAGFVHRDLKPSNVLVTHEGRVVILDFGLISERESNKMSLTPTGALLGTPSFIAPEHAAQQRADKPADLYAVGVMLFQALTGTLPFRGSAARILVDKQEREAPLVSELVPDAPDELVDLCRRLLDRDPSVRPTAPEALVLVDPSMRRTGPEPSSVSQVSLSATLPPRTELVDALQATLTDVRAGEPVTVHLRELAGSGRGSLVDAFVAKLRADSTQDQPLILRGRCLERESVPFKGLDPFVDALTLQLRNLGPDEVEALRPKHTTPLLQMFPVMSSVWPSQALPSVGLDRSELRSFGQASLRELLIRAGLRHTLVVCAEDFHWADVESAQILAELTRAPGAPRMLLIVSYAEGHASEALDVLFAEEHLRERRLVEIDVGPLSTDETRALAREMLGPDLAALTPAQQAARVEEYVALAAGDPFLLGQLIAESSGGAAKVGSLDQLVVRRLIELDKPAQRVLALVAACDTLSTVELTTRVSSDDEDFAALLEQLTQARLLVEPSPGKYHTADPRIREIVLGELEADELVELHRALAEAFLETGGASFEALANHLVHAGQRARASEYFELAARQAAEALAFEGAVRLYRRAARTMAPGADATRERALQGALADQLINAGRGPEAIGILVALADQIAQTEPERSRAHRRLAAELLLRAGRIDEGLALISALLEELGEQAPRAGTSVLERMGLDRVFRRFRSRSRPEPKSGEASPLALERLDTLAIWTALADPEARLFGTFQARYLRLAIDAGEPLRLCRGYAQEAVHAATTGDEEQARTNIESARALLADRDEPVFAATVEHLGAMAHARLHRWRDAATSWAGLLWRLREAPRVQYIRAVAASHYAPVLLVLGECRALMSMAPSWLLTTRELGYRREDAMIAAAVVQAQLMLGVDPGDAGVRAMLERASSWTAPNYSAPDFAIDLCQIDWSLAGADFDAALERCAGAFAAAESSHVLSCEFVELELVAARGRCCAAALAEGRDDGELTRQARDDARRLRKTKRPMHLGRAAVIDAALAAAAGDRGAAQTSWAEAATAFASAQMKLHLAAVEQRRGSSGAAITERSARLLAPAP